MVLGIAEDFSSTVTLDSALTALPSSGLYLNSGVHPSITVENLLAFLPFTSFEIPAWDESVTYGNYESSRNKKDLVSKDGVLYQSKTIGNINHDPGTPSPDFWLQTNIESLRLKAFIDKVKDRVYADLNLTKRLVNNAYLYENNARHERTLPQNYCGWIFEPKGSDYVSFRINQMCIQKTGTTPVDVYVINQGVLVDTLQVTPANGIVEFQEIGYTFNFKGKTAFVIDSTNIISNNGYIDSLKYDGFTAYACVGIGISPETARYSLSNTGNGLGFNISAFLDSSVYIENNLSDFGNYIRATFEYMAFQMFLHNSGNRKNMAERVQLDADRLLFETSNLDHDTAVSRYNKERAKAIKALQKTFDTQLDNSNELEVTVSSI